MMEHPQLPLLLKIELHPELHPLSHPQFVAVKSLMRLPPNFNYSTSYASGTVLTVFFTGIESGKGKC